MSQSAMEVSTILNTLKKQDFGSSENSGDIMSCPIMLWGSTLEEAHPSPGCTF